ncbi:hypothetical protein QO034_06495 [Sedimentitalea sp. JM2-8]|uniref:DUF86 domain-containing protein n=1 Tax=Sedimentitalea xiamensis TaxID=3050037 RepID=A0ABT7FCJ9_9RHOB|nr:hypothetical protein [Sedimentitalea xiamensis]MDK3072753.1 hypothetical protein [Sedimentitalea xiamensis]
MASPAEIANDMAAQAVFWQKRDKNIHRACDDAARMIRAFMAEERVDGRAYHGLHRRLFDLSVSRRWAHYGINDHLDRALRTIQILNREAR